MAGTTCGITRRKEPIGMYRRRNYWVPARRWQLEEWLVAWQERTGRQIPNLRRKNRRELYALFFAIMEEYEQRQRAGRRAVELGRPVV